jgi:uncharacterized repeat protein (TIGR01451 family)
MPAPETQLRRDSKLFGELCRALLARGHSVKFRAHGESMRPNLLDGDDVIVVPADSEPLCTGDVILTQDSDGFHVHRMRRHHDCPGMIVTRGDAGRSNDLLPTRPLGKVITRQRGSRRESFGFWRTRLVHPFARAARRFALAANLRWQRTAKVLFFWLILFFSATSLAQAQNADLALTQSVSPSVVAEGANLTYTEVVKNNGPAAANTAVLYQEVPPNTAFVSINATGGTTAGWACNTQVSSSGATQVICTNASFASGASTTFTYVVTVSNATPAGTTIVNSANVTSQTTDSNGANNAATTTALVEITGDADLAVSLEASPTPVFIFSTLVYQIQVNNLGLSTANGVTLTDAFLTAPAGLTFVSAVSSQGTCTGGLNLSCALGTLAANASATVTLTVTSPSSASTLTNTASVSTSSTDPVLANNNSTAITVVQPLVCATPGKDGAAPVFSVNPSIVNAYYPPAAAGTLAAGSTSLNLGAAAAGGAQTAIAVGDLLLIIQIQDAAINFTNTSSYGDGMPGDPASGWTALNNAGNFEFITANSTVPVTGGTLAFKGTGPTGGLLNTYTSAAYNAGAQGQRSYQVLRVPQYTSVTLSSNLSAMAWNGATGGVLAIDATSQVTLGSTVALDGLGFRAAGGRILGGVGGAAGFSNTDYVTLSTSATNASKGEGIAGTPAYVLRGAITALTQTALFTGSEGLPNGSYSRGAPGNAGGGGTDGRPSNNDQNSGGGGGGNGGAGGYGGYGWNTATINGGFGGIAFPATTSSMILGGGGGAGTTNDGSYYIPANGSHNADCGASCTGIYSSGAAGGGIAILHAGSVVGAGAITSNGLTALDPDNDGAGGGGGGGSIRVLANSGGLGGLTVAANGGNGGNPWVRVAPGGFTGNRHGPGGGGGGGVIFLSSASGSSSVLGGANGVTTQASDAYGATPGTNGSVVTTASIPQTPGTQPGAYCASTDLSVTNSGSPAVVTPGGNITYTQVVKNNGSFDAVNAAFGETIPANTTFQSITTPSGWACSTPAVGATGTISCSNPDFAGAATSTFTVVVQVNAATPSGAQIVDVANITSGTTDPNLANNSAIAITTVGATGSADLAVTNTPSAPTVNSGANFTVTAVLTNQGPAAATGLSFSEAIPLNTTLGALFISPAGWVCNPISVGGTGTLSCTISSLAAGGSASFPLVLNVNAGTASGTPISATANIASGTPDPNPTNNSATATITVASAGQADLAVTVSATPNPVTQGNNITYTQSVINNGPAAETNATFADTIPPNTTLAVLFSQPAGWTCNSIPVGGTGTFTCTLNAAQMIASGASVNFPMVVKVNPTTAPGTTITNSPSVSSTVGDPIPGNNPASASIVVASPTQSDVAIVKTAAPEPVNQGTNLTYTLQITNHGPAVAHGVTVTDNIPTSVTFGSVTPSEGSCVTNSISVSTPYPSITQVACTLGSISVGGQAIITINVTATTFSSNSLSTNTATVISTTSDPNLSNNSSSAVSTIQSPTAVDISSFRAFLEPDNTVLLEWRTHEESRNLGFHVYREDVSGRHQIDPSLIAGSALLLRGSKPQHAAKLYRWLDPQPSRDSVYWIEDVDINGARTVHGPVYPESATPEQGQSAAMVRPSPLLSERHSLSHISNMASRPLVTPPPISPVMPLGFQRFNAADHAAVKIAVDHEGWYQIPMSQLLAAGLDPETDLRSLHLYAEGVEQPLLMTGHQTGLVSPTDAIEFYGTGIDTPFSATRVYWLVRENHPARHILPASAVVSGSTAPASFPFTVIREDRTTYFAALLNGEDNDNFFGALVTSEPVDQDLVVAHTDTTSALPITLDLTLQGGTDAQEHRVTVQFNGASIGEMDFFGQTLAKQSFPLDSTLLREATNTVTLTSQNGDNDVSVVQSITLHYAHTYMADADWLRATVPSGSELHIGGFSNPQIRTFDITDPLNISELTGKISAETGSYGVTIVLPRSALAVRTILAFSHDVVSAPLALTYRTPTFLDDHRAGAEIVIIAHPDFVPSLAPLVSLRESQGHHVTVLTTDRIYDEYNYGERSPIAIRSFLEDAASHWQRKPQSILFVGDASFDPRNYLGLGEFDFVPTRMIETLAFKTASDDWFTDFLQNGFATIPTGRLPVRTPADTDLVVSKIVNYELGSFAGAWNGQAVLVADQNVDANFTAAATSAAANLPPWLQVSKILSDGSDAATARSQILFALNNGALLVNYEGHGSEQQWSFSDLFNTDDAARLTNAGRLPVYILMDCLNGFFQDVYAQSLAEALLLSPNGGAVAVWASSGFTDQAPQSSMDQAFLHQFAAHPNHAIGRLLFQAKADTTDKDVRRTWILFGDPAMKFQITPSSGSPQVSQTPNRSIRGLGFDRSCKTDSACSTEKSQP